MKRLLLFLFTIATISFIYTNDFDFIKKERFLKVDTNILLIKTYSAIDKDYLDDNDIASIDLLFESELKSYGISKITLIKPCKDDDCALEKLNNNKQQYVIYTKIMKLGKKLIFSGSVLNDTLNYSRKIIVQSIEDMEPAVARLAAALVYRETIEDVANTENIISKEEVESTRRKSLSRVGFGIGYMYPFSDSYNYTTATEENINSRKITLTSNYFYEFNNNYSLLNEFVWHIGLPLSLGSDISIYKYLNNTDFSPFIGGGIGIHWVSNPCLTCDWTNENYIGHGPKFNFQTGIVFFRTYDINVISRLKYHFIMNSNSNNGLLFDVAIEKRLKDKKYNSSKNSITSVATGLGYGCILYLVVLVLASLT